jgi:hypothetical protein
MLKMKSKIYFLISCFILASTPAALCITSAPIIYVAGDGSGDFNCDGRDDHVQINQTLQFVSENSGYTTVYLKGPFTYFIDDTLLIGSNTIIEGDSSATIKLTSGAGWEAWKPMIKERSPGSHDITIRGFTIDGNRGDQTDGSGHGYYNLIHLTGCQNINVYNMYLTNNDGDGLKTDKCSNLKFYDNIVSLLGHDGLYASTCSDVEAYNNTITCRTNSALRMYNTNRVSLHDNILTSKVPEAQELKSRSIILRQWTILMYIITPYTKQPLQESGCSGQDLIPFPRQMFTFTIIRYTIPEQGPALA